MQSSGSFVEGGRASRLVVGNDRWYIIEGELPLVASFRLAADGSFCVCQGGDLACRVE